jgi:hypothetical protein
VISPWGAQGRTLGAGEGVGCGRAAGSYGSLSAKRHLDKAFASLNDVPVRELVATSEALERRKDGLRDFASIFRNVADAREGGWGTDLPRFHPGRTVSRAERGVRRADLGGRGPFWAHVRRALGAVYAAGSRVGTLFAVATTEPNAPRASSAETNGFTRDKGDELVLPPPLMMVAA